MLVFEGYDWLDTIFHKQLQNFVNVSRSLSHHTVLGVGTQSIDVVEVAHTSGIDILAALNLPSAIYNMMPYIISLLVLALTSKKSRAPKAEGIPYDKGSR